MRNIRESYSTLRSTGGEKSVFEMLTLMWNRFSPLEEQLLTAVRSCLPLKAQTIFDAQVASFNKVQRLPPSWNEISFYRVMRGKPKWNNFPRFPRTDEFGLAEIRFGVCGKRYKATLTSVDGHIFSFAIAPSPKSIAFAAWNGECEVKLLADPMRAPTGSKELERIPMVWRQVIERAPRLNITVGHP